MKKIERVGYVDVYRGMGIILMIMGHVGYGTVFDKFIHAFHMPMFFFISGVFFVPDINLAGYVKKKAKTLLLPYLFFGVFHYVIYSLMYGFKVAGLKCLFFYNTELEMPIAGAIWFLTALFFSCIIVNIIHVYIKFPWMKICIICVISIIGTIFKTYFNISMPYALNASFVGCGFIEIGYLMKKSKYWITMLTLPLPIIVGGGVGALILIFVNGYINMRTGEYGIIFFFWVNALTSIMVCLNFSKFIYNRYLSTKTVNFVCYVGRNAMIFLVLNQFFILIFYKVIMNLDCVLKLQLSESECGFLFLKMLITVCTLAFLAIISRIIKKSKLLILIGK